MSEQLNAQQREILLVDKPEGISSFDVIRRLRRILGIKKMGHAGTLDPLASGLMILGVNKGTKKLTQLTGLDKTYSVVAKLGARTLTGDREGEVIEYKDASNLTVEEIQVAVKELVGDLELPVPIFSAVKRGGEALYKKARRGDDIEVPIRIMKVHSLVINGDIEYKDKTIMVPLEMRVASGVYVRSVVEALGARLSVPAMTHFLRRTSIGDFTLEDSDPAFSESLNFSYFKTDD